MKVRMRVSTNRNGSEIVEVCEFEDDFEQDDFEMWVWENIDASFEILQDDEEDTK